MDVLGAIDCDHKRVMLVSSVVACILFITGGGAAEVKGAAPLRALVPLKTSFTEFVSWSGSPQKPIFGGFCVDVFRHAVNRLPSGFLSNYSFVPFGDGTSNPSYADMIDMLKQGKADAIVADITISMDRLEVVDFTQPFMPSALVMATPLRYGRVGSIWDFLRPFTMALWIAILLAFIGTGLVMFALEYKNPDFHQGQSKPPSDNDNEGVQPSQSQIPQNRFTRWSKKLVRFYWFMSLTLFFSQQETVTTHAGRFVTVVWLLVVLIFTSSYTASLASTLSEQEPFPTIGRFEFLRKSSAPIGYQGGAFIHDYLTGLGIPESRLKALDTEQSYADNLRLGPNAGGVAAVVDEQPYVESFLNTECQFTSVGNQIAFFGGFGFAFAKNSSLTNEMSRAILSLAQDGTLQMLKNKWVGSSQCTISTEATTHMKLSSFGGLFIILAAVYGMCLVWRMLALHVKSKRMKTHIGRVFSSPTPGNV